MTVAAPLVAGRIAMCCFSRFWRTEPRARTNNFCCRMVFGIADDHNAPSASFNFGALGNALDGVVRSLRMNVGADFADDGTHVSFRENYYSIYIGKSRKNFRAFFRWNYRPSLPF